MEKCQLEPSQEFTQLNLAFKTPGMTLSLPQDKVLVIRTQAFKVDSSPMCRGVMRLLGLTNFVGMTLLLAKLFSFSLQFWLRETYKPPTYLFKGI